MLAVRALDGLAFSKVVTAGTYFLKKYRRDLNDLNVFPVPDGDTGTNLYLTLKAAMAAATSVRRSPLGVVAAEAAKGALFGARGNSGVILAQMLRGFAQAVRDRNEIATSDLGAALKRAVEEARFALAAPVDGTIVSVAAAVADHAVMFAEHEADFRRVGAAIVQAANDALERTPEQLAVLREAGVVDAGGAGLLYFLEAILRFGSTPEPATAYPRRAMRRHAFSSAQHVSSNTFCTEFVLTGTGIGARELRKALDGHGDALLVAGEPPVMRVHIHTDVPQVVQAVAGAHGRVEQFKAEDMQHQHAVLVAQTPKRMFSFLAVVPGLGFDRIARELGADASVVAYADDARAAEIERGIERCASDVVIVLPNGTHATQISYDAAAASGKCVIIAPTTNIASGIAVLIENGGRLERGPIPSSSDLEQAAARIASATVTLIEGVPFGHVDGSRFTGESLENVLGDAARRLGADGGGLLTLYYGGIQKESDAERIAQALRELVPKVEIEWFFGGQRTSEYVVSFER
jgi:hypothetical protein